MTWSYELNYTLKNLNFTLAYSHTKDPQNTVLSKILDVIPTFEIKPGQDSNITVQIPVNLQSSDYFGLTASAPVRINKWWNMTNNFDLFYNKFNGNIGGSQLNNGKPAANIRTNNAFTFTVGHSGNAPGAGSRMGSSAASSSVTESAPISNSASSTGEGSDLPSSIVSWRKGMRNRLSCLNQCVVRSGRISKLVMV